MVPPLPLGTVLRQRYLIQQVLGQGGFGRTYLALDQERFNEPCVLKEFTVPYHDTALVEKSKLLFHREASTLYQIQHPQIPRFWAAFEDEQRLFLVQDFVEGQTYRQLLSDRKQSGQTFSEDEVLHFLNHLLPVLAYIHGQGIIHRDISPENVILRSPSGGETSQAASESGLPVLIDFGAVKEAASHWPLMTTPTRVGKVGYAPPEQLQTGKVYPNSDLYALAATSLVLLTGREPQTLLDSRTLSWQWQPYANISDEVAMLLQKMLAVYPGERYQSAAEVLQDLHELMTVLPGSTLLQSPLPRLSEPLPLPASTHSPPSPVPVLAVVEESEWPGADEPESSSQVKYVSGSKWPRSIYLHLHEHGGQLSRLLRWGVGSAVLAGLGIATPILWHTWRTAPDSTGDVWVSGAKLPQSEASRIIDAPGSSSNLALRPSAAPTDTDESSPTKISRSPQRIQFPPGKIATVLQGTLQNSEMQPYILEAAQGQIMTATVEGPGAVMNLLRSNQEAIDSAAYQTHSWTGALPANDHYLIQVSGSGPYTLDIAVTPLSRPTQEQLQRVAFAHGKTGTTVTGVIAPNQVRRYLLKAKQRQILAVKVLQGGVTFSAIAPDGQRIGGSSTNAQSWQGRVPQDGDYVIEVSSRQPSDYAISLEVF